MDSALENKLSQEFESAFSQISPNLVRLLQDSGISAPLELSLESSLFDATMAALGCCFINGKMKCPCPSCRTASGTDALGLEANQSKQLGRDVEAELKTTSQQLTPILKQVGESFNIQFIVDPKSTDRHLSCKFQEGVLICS